MVVSNFFPAIDALVALFGTDGELVELAGMAAFDEEGYVLFDGEPTSAEYPPNVLIIGWDGDSEGDFRVADVNQDWADAKGSRRRDEQFEIPGCVICKYGEADSWKPARDRAKTVLADLETKLRENPDLGLPDDSSRQFVVAEYKPTGAFQEPFSDTGFWFRMQFVVRVSTRV
jgi:hypothetical protein